VPESVDVIYIDKTKIKLDDGDTFSYDGMDIRVLGMDTPEIAHPEKQDIVSKTRINAAKL
jgi:endonuclease YncB( thermonuclease family)